jgi:hypothetical protein
MVNAMYVDLDPLAFILHFASQLCIASKLVCSLLEAIADHCLWLLLLCRLQRLLMQFPVRLVGLQ